MSFEASIVELKKAAQRILDLEEYGLTTRWVVMRDTSSLAYVYRNVKTGMIGIIAHTHPHAIRDFNFTCKMNVKPERVVSTIFNCTSNLQEAYSRWKRDQNMLNTRQMYNQVCAIDELLRTLGHMYGYKNPDALVEV